MQEKTIAKAIQYHLLYSMDDMLVSNIDAVKLSQKGIQLFKPFADYEHKQELLNVARAEAAHGWKARQYIYDNWMPAIYKGLVNTFMALKTSREFMTDEKYQVWWGISIQELATPLAPYLDCDKVIFYDDYLAMQNPDIDTQHENLRINMLKMLATHAVYKY